MWRDGFVVGLGAGANGVAAGWDTVVEILGHWEPRRMFLLDYRLLHCWINFRRPDYCAIDYKMLVVVRQSPVSLCRRGRRICCGALQIWLVVPSVLSLV